MKVQKKQCSKHLNLKTAMGLRNQQQGLHLQIKTLDGLSVFKSVVSIDDTFPSATAVTDGAKNGMLGR